jgi:retinol dehydrogenase 12
MSDRTVLITGATSGIGYETALVLASQGARVLITGRNPSRGEEAIAAIRRQVGHQHVEFLAADHSTVGANQELAREARASLASLDVLINNVGSVFSDREETADGYEATLALCFVGPVALTQELLPVLRASGAARAGCRARLAYARVGA